MLAIFESVNILCGLFVFLQSKQQDKNAFYSLGHIKFTCYFYFAGLNQISTTAFMISHIKAALQLASNLRTYHWLLDQKVYIASWEPGPWEPTRRGD